MASACTRWITQVAAHVHGHGWSVCAHANAARRRGLVFVVGPLRCPEGVQGEIHTSLTQESTAAEAVGSWTGARLGSADQTWRSQASAIDQPFVAEPARACAVGIIRQSRFITSAGQWCDDVTLVAGS